MRRHQIPKVTMNRRLEFIRGNYCAHRLAKELKLSTITTWRYGKEFERIRAEYPEKLKDLSFYIPEPPKPHRETPLLSG